MQEAKSLGLEEAKIIANYAIEAVVNSEGRPMSVAVVGRDGGAICLQRMDGASKLTARMALTKAKSAIDVLKDLIDARENHSKRDTGFGKIGIKPYEFSSSWFTTIPGGCLIKTKDGNVVGAIGASGRIPVGAPDHLGDEEIARAGVKAFEECEAYHK